MRTTTLCSLSILALTCCATATLAAPIEPLATRNQSPLAQVYGLPAAAGARVVPAGGVAAALRYDLANNIADEAEIKETLLLDGESTRLTLDLKVGLGHDLEAGVEVPYVAQRGGFLDRFIDGWHNTFGLQANARDQAPRNRLHYLYVRNGETRLDFQRSSGGLGDITLNGAWQFLDTPGDAPRAMALRVALKLPTGDSARLLGSGGADLAVGLAGDIGTATPQGDVGLYGGFGLAYLSPGDILPGQQRRLAGYGHLGAGWRPLNWLTLQLQLDGLTGLYRDSELAQLDNPSLQLAIGGSLLLPGTVFLDLAAVEDIAVATAPDVAFHLALRHRF